MIYIDYANGKLLHLAHCTLHLTAVHLTDQLSNFGIIPDYLKVVDFIEETENLA